MSHGGLTAPWGQMADRAGGRGGGGQRPVEPGGGQRVHQR